MQLACCQIRLLSFFYFEALVIGIFGSFLGVTLGVGLNIILGYAGIDVSAQLSGVNLGVSTIIYPQNSVLTTVSVFLYAVIISGLTTLLPSRRCAKITPIKALRRD